MAPTPAQDHNYAIPMKEKETGKAEKDLTGKAVSINIDKQSMINIANAKNCYTNKVRTKHNIISRRSRSLASSNHFIVYNQEKDKYDMIRKQEVQVVTYI